MRIVAAFLRPFSWRQEKGMSHFWKRSDITLSVEIKIYKVMFQLDQVLEYWATKYKPISHDPAAKSKDKGYDE